MLTELIEVLDFIDEVFPNVDADVKDKAKKAIEQFAEKRTLAGYLTTRKLNEISQGDILSEMPFSYYEADGTMKSFKARGIILSVSCDIDNDNYIIIAPMFKLSDYKGATDKIVYNNTLTYLYFPDHLVKDYYVDFSFVSSYSKKMIFDAIEKKIFERIASLTLVGYYMFITKFSAFLARREDNVTQKERFEKT